MNITEDDAKTKYCCADRRCHCVANDCMAWRWGEPIYDHATTSDMDTPPDGNDWFLASTDVEGFLRAHGIITERKYRWMRVRSKRGYCGLVNDDRQAPQR